MSRQPASKPPAVPRPPAAPSRIVQERFSFLPSWRIVVTGLVIAVVTIFSSLPRVDVPDDPSTASSSSSSSTASSSASSSLSPSSVFVSPGVHRVSCHPIAPSSPSYCDFSEPCGRVVADSFITPADAAALRNLLEYSLQVAQNLSSASATPSPSTSSPPSVSIFDFSSGAISTLKGFISLYPLLSRNSLSLPLDGLRVYREVVERLRSTISSSFGVAPSKLHLGAPSFLSKITHGEVKSLNDEYWHEHVDLVQYEAFAFTALVYLNSADDFKGGDFVYVERGSGGITHHHVVPQTGRVNFFTSGHENPHFVQKVTEGQRFAMTVAFTCSDIGSKTESIIERELNRALAAQEKAQEQQ